MKSHFMTASDEEQNEFCVRRTNKRESTTKKEIYAIVRRMYGGLYVDADYVRVHNADKRDADEIVGYLWLTGDSSLLI